MDKQAIWKADQDRWQKSYLHGFKELVASRCGHCFENYQELHRWSIEDPGLFWQYAAEFLAIRWTREPIEAYRAPPPGHMIGAQWFPGGLLSWTENLLPRDEGIKIISIIEGRDEPILYTGPQLREAVARLATYLKRAGVDSGDRVAGILPNTAEAVIGMLATASLGAIWTSCSPDFGLAGIVDRFGQVEPKVLIATRSYSYNGKVFDCRSTARDARKALSSIELSLMIDPLEEGDVDESWIAWDKALREGEHASSWTPLSTSFDHPLYILYSSGTTGKPKCIVHSVGGTLLQHKKELMLHCNLGPDKRLLYFTTCGWMMWNWMVSALSTGAGLVLFEGSVTRENHSVLWRAVAEHKVNCFGTSPRFLASCQQAGMEPAQKFELAALETILSTGSPLLPEQYSWVYTHAHKNVHLASISGGTDIISCFMLGNPWSEVRAGEIQGAGLGMAVDCWSETGETLRGEKGELVCTKPFPSMPLGFWRDDGQKYLDTYFSYYPGRQVWRHGDFIEITEHGSIIVYGRSDATLNPGGVRIGTAEIYRQVEAFPEIQDSLAISRERAGDAEVLLFIKMQPDSEGKVDAAELQQRIKLRLRQQLSPRHVPAAIYTVADIPYTRSGKKLELAVTRIFHGQSLDNLSAIANPESLDIYRQLLAAETRRS